MSISVGDVIHIAQVISIDGVKTVFGGDYKLQNAGSATTDLELLNSLMDDNWTPTLIDGVWQAANIDDLKATCAKVQKILPNVEDDFIYIQNVSGGIVTGDFYPAHAAVMVTKTGKNTGRGSTGRTFFPAPPELHFTGGQLNVLGQGLWDPVASFLNDVLNLGAFSTVWAPQHVQKAGVSTDVFRTWVNPNIRTVRSRQAVDCPV